MMLWVKPSVEIIGKIAIIVGADFQALPVIGCPPGEAGREQALGKHIGTETINHFRKDDSGFGEVVWPGQYLPT